jgi:NAD(P)-dependent dehydrogenase (short-subunit alcohol dehydrogenase family)
MAEWTCAGSRFDICNPNKRKREEDFFYFLMCGWVAVHLLSPLAQFVTGMTLTVDGGMDMRG